MSKKKYDVVYLLKKSNWNEEIRYSIRSLELFFGDLGEIWIIGYFPPYLNRATLHHVPEPHMPIPGVFIESIAKRFINNELEDLSEDYIFATDDCYILKPVTIKDFSFFFVEDLSQISNRGTRPWQIMLWRTYDILVHMGYTGYNYESHTPTFVNKEKYRLVSDIIYNIDMAALRRYDSVCTITAYWNIVGVSGEEKRLADHFRIGFIDDSRNETEKIIKKQLKDLMFFFHNDQGLNDSLREVIKKLYPTKSRFEL